MYEDSQGRIWATQWSGGLLQFDGNGMVPQPWNTPNPPTDIAEANQGQLWIKEIRILDPIQLGIISNILRSNVPN